MTAIHTHTTPRTGAPESQHVAAVRHEHSWATESRHPTSAGHVLYVRCTACGIHRVDLQGHHDVPPAPLSRVVGGEP
ncbi:hypothetical protein [Promicromonospora panici]|uniref:hypothetical protein n=1 Tax=Promicromonospora panici TaxID=2219658 RepID=UPI00101BCA5A|nr:hypothetical protein [Promicromonospora panici]